MNDTTSFAKLLTSNEVQFVENEPLKNHTTFKIGGLARYFCTPSTLQQLMFVLSLAKIEGIRTYFIGKGSNVLFADSGFDGAVINIADGFDDVDVSGEIIEAGAGAPLAKVCLAAAAKALSGLEFAYGIPGSVGGAVYMNAGAYGGEIKDVLTSVTFIDENGELCTMPAGDLALAYRTSLFDTRTKCCIISAKFSLEIADEKEIRDKMADYAHRRMDKQPLDMPSAGSTFKRPEGAFAGALIDKCGLRGYGVGGAQISTKHCGFVVNKGGATCEDVLNLTDEVCKIVAEQTGYKLEKEIRVVR